MTDSHGPAVAPATRGPLASLKVLELGVMFAAPFAGRLPIFIGDDVTDEDGMREARRLGGAGYRVDAVFRDPEGVRSWLCASAAAGDWARLP